MHSNFLKIQKSKNFKQMKQLLLSIILVFVLIPLNAQDESKKDTKKKGFVIDSTSVFSLDKTIKTLYKTISAEKNQDRNWKQFKYLFKPDAKLIPAGKNNEGKYNARYLSPDDYIKNSSKWLKTNGFIEREIHRKVNIFGNIAHVFSTYKCFHNQKEKKPFMRGINSIQLLNDGKRWWIVNIFWSQETKKHPIPKAYLPRKKPKKE